VLPDDVETLLTLPGAATGSVRRWSLRWPAWSWSSC
jgi:hypothetical protein